MKIKLLDKNDKRLKEKCVEVDDFSNMEYYKEVMECMKEECIKQHAFASAAPQFGINKRFILIITTQERNVKNMDELNNLEIEYSITPYFNPVITKMRGL